MPSESFELIKEAIQERRHVVATYNEFRREMCPHVLGWKSGREQALMYQFAGESSSGLEPDGSPSNWRCVVVENLRGLAISDGPWHTAPNHSRPQTCVDEIAAEVEFVRSQPA